MDTICLCLRCGETEVPYGGDGLCNHCRWALPYEVEQGLRQLEEFAWAHDLGGEA